MTEKLILEKLDDLSERLLKIEQVVSILAVQDEKILNLQSQVSQLWKKHDIACGPEGIVNQVKNFQASCPRESFKDTIGRQWVAIGLLATITTGTLLKALGVF